MPVIGTVCPGTQDNVFCIYQTGFHRHSGAFYRQHVADKKYSNAGAVFCRNAPALSVRSHLKLCILVNADRDVERRQPVIGTVCHGGKNLVNWISRRKMMLRWNEIVWRYYQCAHCCWASWREASWSSSTRVFSADAASRLWWCPALQGSDCVRHTSGTS